MVTDDRSSGTLSNGPARDLPARRHKHVPWLREVWQGVGSCPNDPLQRERRSGALAHQPDAFTLINMLSLTWI